MGYMNRRALLSSLGVVGAVGLAGCSQLSASTDDDIPTPDFVAEWDCEFTHGGDTCYRIRSVDATHFVYLLKENTIRIEGCYGFGSANCQDPVVSGMEYLSGEGQLIVRFGAVKSRDFIENLQDSTCQGSVANASYVMTVTTASRLPSSVKVIEAVEGSTTSATYRV